MITVKEFLAWYNNLDVAPFLEAVEKMSAFWQERNIDMFKDGISVPGLTLTYTSSRSLNSQIKKKRKRMCLVITSELPC